jgi:hypothetical protein
MRTCAEPSHDVDARNDGLNGLQERHVMELACPLSVYSTSKSEAVGGSAKHERITFKHQSQLDLLLDGDNAILPLRHQIL